MKKLIALSVAFFSFNTFAHMDCLIGDYIDAHGEKVFSITGDRHSGMFTNTKTGGKTTLKMLNEKQILSLWKKMHWAAGSARDAECAADKKFKNVVCELSNTDAEPKFNHSSNIYLGEDNELVLVSHKE